MTYALALMLANALQAPPDFSGRWVLDAPVPSPPDAVRVLVVAQPMTRTNVRGEPMPPAYLRITIRRERDSGATSETHEIGIIGGTVEATGQSRGPTTRFETVWRDNSLMFLNRVDGPDGPHTGAWSERSEAWSFDPDGRLRVEVVSESHDHARQAGVWRYRRE
jgi:hypothetical protein